MKLYTIITIENYVATVHAVTPDKEYALSIAKEYAGDWSNEETAPKGEIYFNQREQGNMENAVSVQETLLTYPKKTDTSKRAYIKNVAETILWNDGIEEYPPDLIEFARGTLRVPESQQPDAKALKAATHAAFGAMLLGLSIDDALDTVLTLRTDILE